MRALFIAETFMIHLILQVKYQQVPQPRYFPPLDEFVGIMIFALLPVVMLFSPIVIEKLKYGFASDIFSFAGSALYLFG